MGVFLKLIEQVFYTHGEVIEWLMHCGNGQATLNGCVNVVSNL